MDKQELGENLYALLAQECPLLSGKLTGMILELADVEIHDVINDAEKRGDLVESGVQVLVESVHQGYVSARQHRSLNIFRFNVRHAHFTG